MPDCASDHRVESLSTFLCKFGRRTSVYLLCPGYWHLTTKSPNAARSRRPDLRMQVPGSKAMKTAATSLPNCHVSIHSESLPPPTPCSKPLPRRRRAVSWQGGRPYPSPPMSDPPSPSKRTSSTVPRTSSSERAATTINVPAPSGPPARTVAPSAPQQPLMFLSQQHFASHAGAAMYNPTGQPFGQRLYHQTQPLDESAVSIHESRMSLGSEVNLATVNSMATGGARRTKAHVPNACGNCKRAHLSCDVQRPCNRCVATGKQV